jgi:hypothetical protein
MAGILDYSKNLFSTQQFRESLLGRNLPPPVNNTLTQSGLVSKLQDIGKVINVPIFGTGDENIPIHYNEDEKLFPLGTFFRTTQNVNLNPYSPQNDEYLTYELTIPPNLGYPLPEGFGEKERSSYPASYSSDRFSLINKGNKMGVPFPFNTIDSYKSLNFQKESSLGLVGGQQLEKHIIDKVSQIEEEMNPNTNSTGYITEPVGNMVDNYVDTLRGNKQFINTLPNAAIGWNEYNSSNKVNGGNGDAEEGVEPTMSTEIRMNTLFGRTSENQVQFTFNLLNRNKFRPLYEDRRLQGTDNEGTNSRYYIGSEKNTNRGSTITKTFDSSDFNDDDDTSGGGTRTTIEGVGEPFGEPNKFFWATGGEQNFNPNTLLYKTQQLVDNNQDSVFINQTKKFFKDKKENRLISRGNAISPLALIDAEANGNFCRVWTVNDRYNYLNAVRNTGLFTSPDGLNGFSTNTNSKEKSVLLDSGFPKYHPTIADSESTKKKFMLSIENLAWADNLADLPLSEVGPGDTLSGNKGRIMWFPPYDLSFDENVAANWTKTDFIGRGEPVYTYNNASRSASLSFKILVDHPRVMNGYRGKSNDLIERFVAGCVTPEDFLNSLDSSVSQSTKAEVEKKLKEKRAQKVVDLDRETHNADLLYTCPKDISPPSTSSSDFGRPTSICPGGSDKDYSGGTLTAIISDIQKFLDKQDTTTNPKIKITINGYDPTSKSIANDRAKEITENIKNVLGSKNISYVKNGVVDSNSSRVEVTWSNDPNNSKSAQPKTEESKNPAGTYDPQEVKMIDSLLIDESAYFDFIDGTYPNYFKTISEKIKYFNPGFHSITPEGLNSRLTFLNQCMRQGPSIYDKSNIQPQNLSFGRPPICILRIGDFYYTKIAINSLSINYDGGGGIQYDLNPEGIGVQPMIATVQLSIELIGGSSLSGPINRLQNALSFNYYANTEVYDPRSDTIKNGKIVDGIKLGEVRKELLGEAALDSLVNDLKKEGTIDQEKDSETGDDTDKNGKDVLEIIYVNVIAGDTITSSITFKTIDNELPSEIVIGNDPNPNNKLGWNISPGGQNTDGSDVAQTDPIVINFEEEGLVDPNKLKSLEKTIEETTQTFDTAKNNFKTFKTQQFKTEFQAAKKAKNDAEDALKEYKRGKKDTIKATAFLTENKTKTKVVKRFTITKEGLT